MRKTAIQFLLQKLDRKAAAKIIESVYPGYSIKKIRADAGTKKVKPNEAK